MAASVQWVRSSLPPPPAAHLSSPVALCICAVLGLLLAHSDHIHGHGGYSVPPWPLTNGWVRVHRCGERHDRLQSPQNPTGRSPSKINEYCRVNSAGCNQRWTLGQPATKRTHIYFKGCRGEVELISSSKEIFILLSLKMNVYITFIILHTNHKASEVFPNT